MSLSPATTIPWLSYLHQLWKILVVFLSIDCELFGREVHGNQIVVNSSFVTTTDKQLNWLEKIGKNHQFKAVLVALYD